jgi:glycosyltransferase involved in cell wall biosynthesis
MRAHRSGDHKSHWLLLAPNSEGLPHGFAESLLTPSKVLPRGLLTGGLLAPSKWAAGVVQQAFPDKTVIVAPHGVTPHIHCPDPSVRNVVRRQYDRGEFNVAHLTSTESDRKGTKALLRAWKLLRTVEQLPRNARLHIFMNPAHISRIRWWASDLGLSESEVIGYPGLMFSQHQMAGFLRTMHLVCQPSRAEGFGMVPLEALACGVPVAATTCTGHSEFATPPVPPGFVEVEHGSIKELDDFPGAMAPAVTADAIATALDRARESWRTFEALAAGNAEAIGRTWSWDRASGPALQQMIKESEK